MNGAQGKDAERAGYSVKKVVQVLKKPKCQCKCAVAKKASNSHKKLKEEDDEKVEKTQTKLYLKPELGMNLIKKPSQDKAFLLENVD
ncbi:unnamed protein product [Bursaphelenchus xylophilus]|nr:unnamed protein product [Bursaphelenchus xylophilus]CAG9126610.1 unnamed protein product [Bursaphelenchus xylophilus]